MPPMLIAPALNPIPCHGQGRARRPLPHRLRSRRVNRIDPSPICVSSAQIGPRNLGRGTVMPGSTPARATGLIGSRRRAPRWRSRTGESGTSASPWCAEASRVAGRARLATFLDAHGCHACRSFQLSLSMTFPGCHAHWSIGQPEGTTSRRTQCVTPPDGPHEPGCK